MSSHPLSSPPATEAAHPRDESSDLRISPSLLVSETAPAPAGGPTGRSSGNSLTLGAHRVLAGWIDAEANKTQRQNSVNWVVVGMGSGSDYAAEADGTADLASAGGAWIDLDVTAMVQAWAANSADNHGLVLLQDAASGYVVYNFCSELGWSPCTAAQAPQLTIWYR